MRVKGYVVDGPAIDYISLSYRRPAYMSDTIAIRRLRLLAQCEAEIKRMNLYGYSCISLPHVILGLRDDRVLEIVSGSKANYHDLVRHRDDVTCNRLDLQVTMMLSEYDKPEEAVERVNHEIDRFISHVREFKASAKGAMRRITYSVIDSHSDLRSKTLYIGSRTSDVMVRVYNKTAEARLFDQSGYAPACLRIELELKSAYADQARSGIISGVSKGGMMRDLLRRYDIDIDLFKSSQEFRLRNLLNNEQNTIKWLRETVSKSVQRLVSSGTMTRDEIIDILFGNGGSNNGSSATEHCNDSDSADR